MKNIAEVLTKIIEDLPDFCVLISNIISAEIKDEIIYLKFPLIRELRYEIQKIFNKLNMVSYNLKISFVEEYKEPFLPFTVLNSKYKNYIFYIKIDERKLYSFIIQKNNLLDGKLKKEFLENFIDGGYSELIMKKVINTSLKGMYHKLKENWTYLHPVIFYNNESINLRLDNIFNSVVDNLKEELKDIKRFVGQAYFTFYDLKNYVDKRLESANES